MYHSSAYGTLQLGVVCLLLSACGGGDGGDDNSINDSTVFNGDVEIINMGNMGNSTSGNEFDEDELSDSQSDCRRPDVFRVGLSDPDANLYLFPESVRLPERSGVRRMIQVPDGNPAYVDSLVVTEIGTISVTHVEQGPEHTELNLFQLDLDNNLESITTAGQFGVPTGRAAIDIALVPGVYCFFLADSFGVFADNTMLTINYRFTPL